MRTFHLCLLGFICTLASLIANSQVNLNQGLVAHYAFNGNATDVSGNGNNGVIQNGVQLTTDRFGNPNSAYNFDGVDDYISIPYSTSLNFSTGFSIAAYFYSTQSTVQTLVGKISYTQGNCTQFQAGLGFASYPGVFFGLNPPSTGCNSQISLNNSYVNTGTYSMNQWNCLVTTFDNGVQKIYLNGSLIQTLNAGFNTLNQCSNSEIRIGSWWSFDPQRFQGKIDDVSIYNRALTQDEVNALCLDPTSCNNWLNLPSTMSFATIGDLDVPGTAMTIEATFNRKQPWTGVDLWQGDLVSKHTSPSDCNYLLRPGSAEITTTNGYFKTPAICPIELNKTYHVAMTYDGATLKFYRNGYLMSQIAATGGLYVNNAVARIGLISTNILQANFLGNINEVRIWNITRTQQELQSNMSQALSNPQTIPGLQAYYKFDNLLNKQGNNTWNLSLNGAASINTTNPNCNFVADTCGILNYPSIQPSFTAPDTVCVNTPVNINNTTSGATSFYWNFCVADVNNPPLPVNLGNPGGFSQPVFMDIVEDNGNFYGFVINHLPGGIVRLDFGNSLLNNPSSVFLGNPSNALNANYGNEGIQVVKANGNWYAITVGGNPASSTTPRLVIVKFGPNLTNPNPTAVNWGNVGNMLEPVDLHVFKENGIWYGFTVNAVSNTVTRFNFTGSFENTPTGVNLGNIGSLNYPTGIYAVNDNGFWRVFITNRLSSSISRLDFGSSLLNAPTGINLGNPGNALSQPRDFTLLNYCGQSIGFAVNQTSSVTQLNFNTLTSTPVGSNLGNLGNLNFPHSLSKLFRAGNDIYSFITNVQNNTLTRFKFSGCNNSSTPGSNLQNPTPITYNAPGTYNINLMIDDGLPTQASYCKQVVVLPELVHTPAQSINVCYGGSVKIGASASLGNYTWNTGATTDSITVSGAGIYWVETSRFGCVNRDSFIVTYSAINPPDFAYQQDMCAPHTVQFSTSLPTGQSFTWDFGNSQTNTTSLTPVMNFNYGSYVIKLKVFRTSGCIDSVSKTILVNQVFDPALVNNADTSICLGDSILLKPIGQFSNYCWQVSNGQSPTFLSGYVSPGVPTTYTLTAQLRGNNLVVNPDFSSGNTGFVSDYSYVSNNTTEGEFIISSNPTSFNSSMANCTDHTSSSGNMMIVNGSPVVNAKVWSQTIPVSPNTNYSFSTWLATAFPTNPANLQFSINGNILGNSINASNVNCQWNQFSSLWNSGGSTSATITIINKNTVAAGNDFLLDDIFFGTVTTLTDSFAVSVTGYCDSIDLSGPDKICSSTDTVNYTIYKPANCSQAYTIQVDNAFADIIAQTPTTVKLVFKQNGITIIRVSYSNNCKTVIDSIPVTIKFSPKLINLGPDIISCRDTSLVLNAGLGFDSYLWQDSTSGSTFLLSYPGTYYVNAQNLCGAQFKDTITFTKSVISPFVVSPLSATVCAGDSVQFTASGGNQYQWQPAANFSQPNASTTKAIIQSSQGYTVQILDPVCNRDTTIIIPVSASTAANIQVSKSNDVSCSNDSAVLKATGGVSYTWTPNAYITRNINSQVTVKPPQNITYYVDGMDALGCKGRDSVRVNFINEGEQKLYIPNAFSPNNDGLNDLFRPTFIGPAASYRFNIYNRWGQLVFSSRIPGVGWNGVFQSKQQPAGVYVYYITAEGGCNGKFEEKGTFILIR